MLRLRKATWALVLFNVVILWWLIYTVHTAGNNCSYSTPDNLGMCQFGTGIGAGIVLFFIGLLWFIGCIVLGVIWLVSRPTKRLYP